MLKLLMNRKIQYTFFPIAFICIAIVWAMAEKGIQGSFTYLLLSVGVVFFILDRIFKPWKFRRLERRQKEAEKIASEDTES